MKETDLDRALERVFRKAFHLTAAQEQALHSRIQESRRKQDQDWTAFTRIMLRLNTNLQPGMACLYWPSRLMYVPG